MEISELLNTSQWPCVDLNSFGNGQMNLLEIDYFIGTKTNQHKVNFADYLLSNPDYLSSFDIYAQVSHGILQ